MPLKKVKRDDEYYRRREEAKKEREALLEESAEHPEEQETEAVEDVPIIEISNLRPAKAKATSTGKKQSSSSVKVINTSNNGRRLSTKKEIAEHLGTNEVEVGFEEDAMILAPKGTGISEVFYVLKEDKSNYVLYNTDLVVEITNHFKLDFDGTTTVGLQVMKGSTRDGIKIVKLTK